jgi:Domain of unknown function (DUF1905)
MTSWRLSPIRDTSASRPSSSWKAPARNARDGSTIRFDARIRKIGNSTVVRLPQEASAKLPSRGQVAVTGLINGTPFRTVVEPDGRRGHWLKVDKTLQPAPGSGQGADVAVELEPTKDWSEPDIRRTFRALLPARPSYPSSGRTSRPWHVGNGCAGSTRRRTPRHAGDASKWASRNSDPANDDPAASILRHAPIQTSRRTANS